MSDYSPCPSRYEGMPYVPCGASGLRLPKVSLGLWHNFGESTPYDVSRELLLAAFDRGITHFDLANNYGPPPGAAETRLGQVLHTDLRRHRDELFISTKAAYDMWDGPYGSGASRKHLFASVDQSLARLNIDYVDLFYCHRYDATTPLSETLQALVDIVHSGKALYVGISRWPADATRYAVAYLSSRDCPLLIYQGRWNLLDRGPETEGVAAVLSEAHIPFIAFSPLAQGLLTARYLHGIPAGSRMSEGRFLRREMLDAALLARLQHLDAFAKERGLTLAQLALSWLLQNPAVCSVLIGVSSVAQLADNLGCLSVPPLSAEDLALLDDIALH